MWLLPLMLVLSPEAVASPLKADEEIVFFPAFAAADREGKEWVLHFHGWVHEPEPDPTKPHASLGLFRALLGLEKDAEDNPLFRRRAGAFLVNNKGDKEISVRIGDRTQAM